MTEKLDIGECIEKLMKFDEDKRVVELTPPHEPEGGARFGSLYSGCEFYDDSSGEQLDHGLTTQAFKVEIDFFKKILVYTKMRKEKLMKVISTKWIDINKGDKERPNIRCRLVGR